MTKPSERIKEIMMEIHTPTELHHLCQYCYDSKLLEHDALIIYLDEEYEREERIFRNSHD